MRFSRVPTSQAPYGAPRASHVRIPQSTSDRLNFLNFKFEFVPEQFYVPEGFHYFIMAKSNRFCFTKNNYSDLDVAILSGDCTKYFKYWCFGKEVGESGTPHLQGYFEFDNSMRLRISATQNRIQLLGLEGYHLKSQEEQLNRASPTAQRMVISLKEV